MKIETLIADYSNQQHAKHIIHLLDNYALGQMGGNQGLSIDAKEHLIDELSNMPHAYSILCYVDSKPAGLLNCFQGFSTFKCKPLINVHDVIVMDKFRGLGISQLLLAKVEEIAKKITAAKLL